MKMCEELFAQGLDGVDLQADTHGGRNGDVLHVLAFGHGGFGFQQGLDDGVIVLQQLFGGEAGFADAAMDVCSFVHDIPLYRL